MYDSEDVFELLNPHEQELTLDDLVEIRKQSALEKLRNLSQSRERIVTVDRGAETDIWMSVDTGQREATTWQGFVRMLA